MRKVRLMVVQEEEVFPQEQDLDFLDQLNKGILAEQQVPVVAEVQARKELQIKVAREEMVSHPQYLVLTQPMRAAVVVEEILLQAPA
jgi:hypothetical protein